MKKKSRPSPNTPSESESSLSYTISQSAAELLAAVLIDLFPGTQIVECAATEQGFFCDFIAEQPVDVQSLILLEEKMRAFIKENIEVRPIDMMKGNAAQLLEHHGQPIRAEEVRKAKSNIVTLFQMGDFCDFCEQPYISGTAELGVIKLFQIEKTEHFLPGEGMVPIRRIHGTACGDKQALKKHTKIWEAAKKADYRQLAKDLQLFTHDDTLSTRALVWLPSGTILKQTLIDWWAAEHRNQGYQPLTTPPLVKENLIKETGYYDLQLVDTISPSMSIDGVDYIIPPTLTPSHAAVYHSGLHSYRELPVRYAECGTILPVVKTQRLRGMHHANLATADYAHSFCDLGHLRGELISSLQFIDKIIKMFGFEYRWHFVGRDKKSAGTGALWGKVTEMFDEAFRQCGMTYVAAQQELAFAGPAAEALLVDSLGREWKGPKIAVDFNIPERFGLRYQGADDAMHVPLLLVRSVFGTVERFVALLLEHTAGQLPLWLVPEQARVVPLKESNCSYAEKVANLLTQAGIRASVNRRYDEQLGKKIHSAENEKVPYVVVVGDKEENNNQLTLRSCDDEAMLQTMTTEELLRKLTGEVSSKALRQSDKRAK